MRKYLHLLILSLLVLKLGCGGGSNITWDSTQSASRVQVKYVKNIGSVNYDTKLGFYCEWSEEAGITLDFDRCIPFEGTVYFSDNDCKTEVLGVQDPNDINKPANYIRSHGKFYQLTYPIQPSLSLLLWTKDKMGICRSYPNTSKSAVFRMAREVNPIIFSDR